MSKSRENRLIAALAGKTAKFRFEERATVTGVVVECKVASYRQAGKQQAPNFGVIVRAGKDGEHTYRYVLNDRELERWTKGERDELVVVGCKIPDREVAEIAMNVYTLIGVVDAW